MAGPQVTLTFAGDSEKLEKSFDDVGASAKNMAGKVDDSGKSFDRMGGGIDTTGSKAGDLESGFRGVTDSMSGFAQIAQGDVMGGLTDLAGGAEALATGFSGVLVPALQRGVAWLKATRVGTLATAAAQKVARVATLAFAAAQRVLNVVMRANPIGIVITVLAALAAAVVVAWRRSETFRNVVKGVWRVVQFSARFAWRNVIRPVFNALKAGFRAVGRAFGSVGRFIGGVWGGIQSGARSAVNFVIGLINRALGAINSLIRGVNRIPGVGIPEIPSIPTLHQGGIVPGAPGSETLALLQAGERVTPAGQVARESRTVRVDLGPEIMRLIRRQVRAEGGNVQIVLGQG